MATNLGIGDTVLINSQLIGCKHTPALVTALHPSDQIDVTVVHSSGLFPLEKINRAKDAHSPGWLTKDDVAAASAGPPPSNARTAPVSSSPSLPGLPPRPAGGGTGEQK